MSTLGVLARGLGEGIKGYGEVRAKGYEAEAKELMWDSRAEKERVANLARLTEERGYQKGVLKEAQIYKETQTLAGEKRRATAATKLRGDVRAEEKEVRVTKVIDMLSETIKDPKKLFIAKNMAHKDFSYTDIVGTPAKKVTPAQEKSYYEIAEIRVTAGEKGTVKEIADSMIKDHNRRVTGLVDTRAPDTRATDDIGVSVTSAAARIDKELTGANKVEGISSLIKLTKNSPNMAKQVIAKLITEGKLLKSDVEEINRVASGEPKAPVPLPTRPSVVSPPRTLRTPGEVFSRVKRGYRAAEETVPAGVLQRISER